MLAQSPCGARHEIPQERSQGIREEDADGRVDGAADHLHRRRQASTRPATPRTSSIASRRSSSTGHYCLGNVGEFWAMTNEERMRVQEINVDDCEGPRAAHRRLPSPEPLRGGQARAARASDRHRLRDHPHALHGGAQRRRRVRFYQARLRAHGHRRRAVQYRGRPTRSRRSSRSASPTIPNICGFKQGVSQDRRRPPRCATLSANRWR